MTPKSKWFCSWCGEFGKALECRLVDGVRHWLHPLCWKAWACRSDPPAALR